MVRRPSRLAFLCAVLAGAVSAGDVYVAGGVRGESVDAAVHVTDGETEANAMGIAITER